MKFVRWLGAFGMSTSLHDAANWEIKQTDRQVCAEPLWHGKSNISHAKIGLEIAHPEATFARGWVSDAYTIEDGAGIMRASRNIKNAFKNMDKFLKAFNKPIRDGVARESHGEATFNAPCYASVVCNKGITPRGKRRAQRLATSLNLPLRFL